MNKGDKPELLRVVPLAVLYLVAGLDEPGCAKSLGHVLKVMLDLAAGSI